MGRRKYPRREPGPLAQLPPGCEPVRIAPLARLTRAERIKRKRRQLKFWSVEANPECSGHDGLRPDGKRAVR